MMVLRRTWATRILLGTLIGAAALGSVLLLVSTPGGLPPLSAVTLTLAAIMLGAWLGVQVRRHWIDQPRLHRAECLWADGCPPYVVLVALEQPVWNRGELGYRQLLLRSTLHLALGQRDRAWLEALDAQLARLPLWKSRCCHLLNNRLLPARIARK